MSIPRHRTAISRNALSRPVSLALTDGLVPAGATFFDYGCGRGGDLERMSALGYAASGWDPVHRPHGQLRSAYLVNLGYVVNVIEDPRERADALRAAWALTEGVLVVAARMDWEAQTLPGLSCGDGMVTTKGTFQKFFSQEELRTWIDGVLAMRSVAAAPGVFYVFRDEVQAQRYFAARVRHSPVVVHRRTKEAVYETNRAILDPLLTFIQARGREPEAFELGHAAAAIAERFGSIQRALALIRRVTGDDAWGVAQAAATDDLAVYLALAAFGGRPKFTALPRDIQLDVRAFFGSYKAACERADTLLFGAGNQAAIDRACREAPVGKLTPEALYIHVSALPRLSPLLRVYEGCGRALTGTVDAATIVKLHRSQPKVSYLVYPTFDREPHPVLHMSVRADLRRLDVRIRDFRRWENPPVLHRKETFVAVDYPGRETFARLTAQEEQAGLFADPAGIGTQDRWTALVASKGLRFHGHRLIRVPASD